MAKVRIRSSALFKLLWIALSIPLAWFVLLPLSYALSVGVRRAIFPWITWYIPFYERIEVAFPIMVWAPVPFLFFLCVVFLNRLAARLIPSLKMSEKKKPGIVVRLSRWLLLYPPVAASGLAFLVLLGVVLACYGHGLSPTTISGAALHYVKCSQCHSPQLPLGLMRQAEEWPEIVQRMRSSNGLTVSDGVAEKITAFMALKGSYSDRWLFRAKCLRCHSSGQMEGNRTKEQWRLLVGRVARISPFAFPPGWNRQIVRFAVVRYVDPEIQPDAAQETFERTCGKCHSLGQVLLPEAFAQGRVELFSRMSQKTAAGIPQDDIAVIDRFIRSLPNDPEAFHKRFPHDAKVEVPW